MVQVSSCPPQSSPLPDRQILEPPLDLCFQDVMKPLARRKTFQVETEMVIPGCQVSTVL